MVCPREHVTVQGSWLVFYFLSSRAPLFLHISMPVRSLGMELHSFLWLAEERSPCLRTLYLYFLPISLCCKNPEPSHLSTWPFSEDWQSVPGGNKMAWALRPCLWVSKGHKERISVHETLFASRRSYFHACSTLHPQKVVPNQCLSLEMYDKEVYSKYQILTALILRVLEFGKRKLFVWWSHLEKLPWGSRIWAGPEGWLELNSEAELGRYSRRAGSMKGRA
jgi:hypothetical protein